MKTRIAFLLVLMLFCFTAPGFGQTEVTDQETKMVNMEPQDKIDLDPAITYGKLDNGVTYYIRPNHKPEKRAELRLVINAGSVLEDDDQQGLAHFDEHMCFNGTKNFKKQELVDYLESIGMRFGPDLNAYTSFDQTVYMLQVPTDSTDEVETAFQILEDWAHQVSFEDDEIDKERGVIVEEWRLYRGADARMRDKQFPILFEGSQYANRLPIGKMDIVKNCPHDALRRFYKDWYRPDLTAVIAVGDFDKDWIESLIKKHFSRLTMPDNARKRKIFPVPDHEETLFAIATDKEATGSRVGIYYKHPLSENDKVIDYRRNIMENLYNGMLSQRLHELTVKPDPPITFGYSTGGRFVKSKEVYILGAGVKEGGIEKGMDAILTEAARARKYGFSEAELERQKKETMRWIENLYNERDKTESRRLASEYINNYLYGEPAPGIEYEYELYQKYLPGITLDEINKLAEKLISEDNRVIMVNAPEKPDVPVPSEDELLAVFANVESKEIMPYVDETSDKPLIEQMPSLEKIVDEKKYDDLGVTQWTLANGVKVILKPTDFKNDEVLFTAFSPGGNSLVDDSNYVSAMAADMIMGQSGLGDFNQIALEKKLAGKMVEVNASISDLSEDLRGSSTPQDLETMFQLIYLKFTAPRKDPDAFAAFKDRMTAWLENRGANPEMVYRDSIMATLTQHNFRTRPFSVELLNEINLDKAYKIYKDRFADASEFTFVIVGNIDLDKIRPLVETYLGGLPSSDRGETWRDTGVRYPDSTITKIVKMGMEPKSRIQIDFFGNFDWNKQNRYDITSTATAFRIKLREVLREDEGGTYGVGVYARPEEFPVPRYRFIISLGCNPERVDELTNIIFAEIDSLKQFGLDSIYVQKVKEMQRRERETSIKKNNFWLNQLESAYYYKEDPEDILNYDEYIDSFSNKTIKTAANEYFNNDHYLKSILVPAGS